MRGKIPGIAGRVVGGIVGHQRLRRWQRPESVGLLSIVRPIIYSQLKVHRVSEPAAKTAARKRGSLHSACKVWWDFHDKVLVWRLD